MRFNLGNRNTPIPILSAFILVAAAILLGLRGSDTSRFKDFRLTQKLVTQDKNSANFSALKSLPPIRTSEAQSKWLMDTLMQSPAKTDVTYQQYSGKFYTISRSTSKQL